MDDLDYILKWTEDLKIEIANSSFSSGDIRVDFLKYTYNVAHCYYKGISLLNVFWALNQHGAYYHTSIQPYFTHIEKLRDFSVSAKSKSSYINSLNRNLLLSTWAAFELSVTALCEGILTEEEKNKLVTYEYREIIKLLKRDNDVPVNEGLKRHLTKHHLTHVPFVRKTDQLFNKATAYEGKKEDDREFLILMSKLRNAHHTNFIYYGKDCEFKFGNAVFRFHNGKNVDIKDPFSPTLKLNFILIGNLVSIWKKLITYIKFEGNVDNPCDFAFE